MNDPIIKDMTMQKAAQMALDVQDACNLSGVVHSFSRVMSFLSDEANRTGKGTDWKNKHPIAVLFADKISSLTNMNNNSASVYSSAYADVEILAKADDRFLKLEKKFC